jgi:ATP-dependent Clp protease ATP-binding subunit ClpA
MRFTERLDRVVGCAGHEALVRNEDFIGPEHLLLTLLDEGAGGGVTVLKRLDVDLHLARGQLEWMVGQGAEPVASATLTPEAHRALASAGQAARQRGDPAVGTEHLVIAFVQQGGDVAGEVLRRLGVTADRVDSEVHRLREQGTHCD